MSKLEPFETVRRRLIRDFQTAEVVDVGEWQSQDVSNKPEMVTRELRHVHYGMYVPTTLEGLQIMWKPNLPWAEDHFQERISGIPLNPPPSEAYWPFAQQGNSGHKEGTIFSHTYPERIWPKRAGDKHWISADRLTGEQKRLDNPGIRYTVGDLDDVIALLQRSLFTRQAYLPIWFPEDTGAVHGGRVPCSIGYHFLCRDGILDCSYTLRSCDFLRHWADDMYMAARLLQHVVGKLQEAGKSVRVGSLIVNISSLHVFAGDDHTMKQLKNRVEEDDEVQYGAGV